MKIVYKLFCESYSDQNWSFPSRQPHTSEENNTFASEVSILLERAQSHSVSGEAVKLSHSLQSSAMARGESIFLIHWHCWLSTWQRPDLTWRDDALWGLAPDSCSAAECRVQVLAELHCQGPEKQLMMQPRAAASAAHCQIADFSHNKFAQCSVHLQVSSQCHQSVYATHGSRSIVSSWLRRWQTQTQHFMTTTSS